MSDVRDNSAALDGKLGTELERLFDGLAQAGLRSGPRERIAATALTASLVSAGVVRTIDELKPLLAPLLARSPDERRLFFQALETAPRPEPGPNGAKREREARPWAPVFGLVLLLLIAGLLAWYLRPPVQQLVKPVDLPSIAYPVPTNLDKTEPGLRNSGSETLDRVATAAEHFEGTPTIEELGRAFAAERQLNWPAESYAIRLHEYSGLPRGQPLPLFAEKGLVWARIALALDRIERPGLEPPVGELASAAHEHVNDRRGTVYKLADQIPDLLTTDPPQTKPELMDRIRRGEFRLRTGRDDSMSPADAVDEFTIQRALAISRIGSDPRVQAIFEGAPWLPRQAIAEAPSWAPWIAALVPLLLAVIWLGNSLALRKAYLRRRPPRVPPLEVELVAEAATQVAHGARQFRRIAQQLQVRTPRPTDRINADATIAATIASGGEIVTPIYHEARDTPEYLVLIERNAASDQDATRLREMIRRLQHLVPIVVFYFRGEPSVLEPDHGGRAVPIERLQAQFSDHRLLILGSGGDLLDPASLRPRAATVKLRNWSRRALLTPLPLAEWGRSEFALANTLDMPIGRATPDGLLVLANLLGLDGAERDDLLDPSGDGLARPLPEILRLRPQRFLYGTPPTGLAVPELIRSLRNFLDGPSFEWLCALAVYPAVQWDLTLFLGVSMRESSRDEQNGKPLYREDRIAALTQLPWLREGQMPNWTRRALIEQLSAERSAEIRSLLHLLLSQADLKADRPKEDPIRLSIGREVPRDHLPPEELLDDEVLLDFLARGRIEDLALPQAANWLERLMPEFWRDRLGIPELAVASVAIVYAFVAAMLAPGPSKGEIPTGAWLPLVALVGGGLIALIVGNLGGAYRIAHSLLVRTCTPALAFALLSAAYNPMQMAFSQALFRLRSHWPLQDWLASPTVANTNLLALAAGTWFVADRFRDRLGIPRRRPHSRFFRVARPAAEILVLAVLVDINAAYAKAVEGSTLIAAVIGAVIFIASWAAARALPDRLPPPPIAPREGRALWSYAGGMLRVLLALLPILPAYSLSRYVAASFQELGEIPGGISAVTETKVPGGNLLAIGGMDGTIRVFRRNGTRHEQVQLVKSIALRAPAMSLQLLRRPADYRILLAIGAGDGRIHLIDANEGSEIYRLADSDGATLPARVALDPEGVPLAAVELADGNTKFVTTDGQTQLQKDQGGAVTAMASVGHRQFLVGTLDGRLRLVTTPPGENPRIEENSDPLERLPGRARILKVDEDIEMLLAIGDDGTLREGRIDQGRNRITAVPVLEHYRQEQLALGEIRRWRQFARPAATPSPTPSPAPSAEQQAPSPTAPVQAAEPFGESITLVPKKVVILRGNAIWDKAFETLIDSFKALTAFLDKQGIKPAGAAMAVYTSTDDTGFTYLAEIPVEQDPKNLGKDMSIGKSPEGKALKFVHRGSYDNMDNTYESITNHLDDKKLQAKDTFIEEYLTDPLKTAEDKLVINVYVPLK